MPLINPVLIPLYLSAALGGVLAGSVGPPLAYSRSVTFGITLVHAVLAGALTGVYLHDVLGLQVNPLVTSILIASAMSLLTAEAISKGFPEDAAIAASVSISVSIAIIMTYEVAVSTPYGVSEALSYVFGSALLSTWEDISRLAAACIVVIPLTHIFWCEYRYIAFDPEGAESLGISVRAYRYLYYLMTAVAASTLAMSLGVLLAHVVISIPGLISLRLKTPHPFRVSYPLSISLLLIGYIIAWYLRWPPAGGVGAVSSVLVATSLVVRRGS